MEVYSIGFTKKSAEKFFGLLKSAGLRRLLDVLLLRHLCADSLAILSGNCSAASRSLTAAAVVSYSNTCNPSGATFRSATFSPGFG